jgi:undecaprenyl pyrophosphate phosphatase UppP
MAILRMAHLSMAAAPSSYFQAVVLGVLQGVTELFPISSLGHTVLFRPRSAGTRWCARSPSLVFGFAMVIYTTN